MIFYSPTTKGFYPADMKTDYERSGSWPVDAVEITPEEHQALLDGQSFTMEIAMDTAVGKPVLKERPKAPLTERRAFVERQRRNAYAAPQTGSDRLFAEVNRMKLMGEPGWETLLEQAKARYLEIKTANPWPTEETA